MAIMRGIPRMFRPAAALVVLMLSGCAGTARTAASDGNLAVASTIMVDVSGASPVPTTGPAPEPTWELDGVYAVDGAPAGLSDPVFMVMTTGWLDLDLGCAQVGGDGVIAGGSLRFEEFLRAPQTASYTDDRGATLTPTPEPPAPTLDQQCGTEVGGWARDVLDRLAAGQTVARTDTGLVLAGSDGRTVVLTTQHTAAEPALTGRRWQLATVQRDGGEIVPVAPDDAAWFELDDTDLIGSDGCNGMSGTVLADGDDFHVFGLGRTEMGCPGGNAAAVSAAVEDLLGLSTAAAPGDPSYRMESGLLTMTSDLVELAFADDGPARS